MGRARGRAASPVPGPGDGVDLSAICRDRKQGVGKMVSSPSDLLGWRCASGNIPLPVHRWISMERSGMEIKHWELSAYRDNRSRGSGMRLLRTEFLNLKLSKYLFLVINPGLPK